MKQYAPILLFTYKRLDTLKLTIESLRKNYLSMDSDLYVFSDGPKNTEDFIVIEKIRKYLRSISGFQSTTIFESEVNKGLANSIIDGVSRIIKQAGKVIVLEDDLKTTPNFLNYMNNSLDHYESTKEVFSISGYSFNLGSKDNFNGSYLLNRGWSWGWATWENRWDKVDWKVESYSDFVKDRTAVKEFSKGGSDLNGMLRKQMFGKLDSWAIRWFYHQFKICGLTLYPITSKVFNNGFDKDATHTNGSSRRYEPLMDFSNGIEFSFPSEIKITSFYQKKFQAKMGILARIISKIQTLLRYK